MSLHRWKVVSSSASITLHCYGGRLLTASQGQSCQIDIAMLVNACATVRAVEACMKHVSRFCCCCHLSSCSWLCSCQAINHDKCHAPAAAVAHVSLGCVLTASASLLQGPVVSAETPEPPPLPVLVRVALPPGALEALQASLKAHTASLEQAMLSAPGASQSAIHQPGQEQLVQEYQVPQLCLACNNLPLLFQQSSAARTS